MESGGFAKRTANRVVGMGEMTPACVVPIGTAAVLVALALARLRLKPGEWLGGTVVATAQPWFNLSAWQLSSTTVTCVVSSTDMWEKREKIFLLDSIKQNLRLHHEIETCLRLLNAIIGRGGR